MAQNLIRNEISYGDLITAELNGNRFYFEEFYAPHFKMATILPDDEIAEFHAVKLNVAVSEFAEVYAYVPKDGNIRALGESLSSTGRLVHASGSARIFARWRDGHMIGDVKKLSDFYADITKEEDDEHSF